MQIKPESCFGIIPVRKRNDQYEIFLVQHAKGSFWAFPKGHGDSKENPKQAAERELKEETNLIVKQFIETEPLFEEYSFDRNGETIRKKVSYFCAFVEGECKLQSTEILDGKWFPLDKVTQQITFGSAQKIAENAIQLIKRSQP